MRCRQHKRLLSLRKVFIIFFPLPPSPPPFSVLMSALLPPTCSKWEYYKFCFDIVTFKVQRKVDQGTEALAGQDICLRTQFFGQRRGLMVSYAPFSSIPPRRISPFSPAHSGLDTASWMYHLALLFNRGKSGRSSMSGRNLQVSVFTASTHKTPPFRYHSIRPEDLGHTSGKGSCQILLLSPR